MTDIDFTAHRHPVMAVICPICRAPIGVMCKRPSGHGASDFHRDRKHLADRTFISMHGKDAAIRRTPDGWAIDPKTLPDTHAEVL